MEKALTFDSCLTIEEIDIRAQTNNIYTRYVEIFDNRQLNNDDQYMLESALTIVYSTMYII
jgi:hypothetical protein